MHPEDKPPDWQHRGKGQGSGLRELPLSGLEPRQELRHLTSAEARDLRQLPWRLVKADDSRHRLVIVVNLGSRCKTKGVQVDETPESVRVIIYGKCTTHSVVPPVARHTVVAVQLAAPLGQRNLIGHS
jgi:hypothetical protein